MGSESARMSSAAEARFRIDYPNSEPRVVKVIALDQASERVVQRAATRSWRQAVFFASVRFDGRERVGEGWSMKAWLSDLAGHTKALVEEVAGADLVVMVSSAGSGADTAAVIAEACSVRKITTLALIIGGAQRSDEELSHTLAALRPHAAMLVIADDDAYIEEMLSALGA